jgi:rhamnogalacturonyl hydrolase YesR
MRPITFISSALIILSGILQTAIAQKQDIAPITYIQKVADKVVRTVPFEYRVVLPKAPDKFDFVQFVDFGRTYSTCDKAIAFAVSNLESEKDTLVELEISHNDGAIVYINNEQVYEKRADGRCVVVQKERNLELMYAFKAKLKKGSNRIVIKSETAGENWQVFIQPKNATTEFSEVKGLRLTLSTIPNIDPAIANITNWLVIGPFPNYESKSMPPKRVGLNQEFGPEKELIFGKMYKGTFGNVTWTIPKLEIFGDVINPDPLWGSLYNFNYHTAGLAWAMGHLAEYTGNQTYFNYLQRYTDFMMFTKPFAEYQVGTLHGFRSPQHHMVNTPLLDFTSAPCLPFVYRLSKEAQFKTRAEIVEYVRSIQTYIEKEQVRLPDGTFTRETPEKFTTWVDDMFMGIPFLVYSSLEASSAAVKKKYLDEAARQVLGFHKAVYDPTANLYMHAQYSTRKVKIPYWSRANGWGVFATTIVLQHLPKNHKDYKKILDIYRKHVAALAKLQNKNTGYWHQILDDPSSYQELSGTAIFTMAIARGINNGWLDSKTYRPVAVKGWEAVTSEIAEDGTVTNICIGTMSSEDPNYYKTRPVAKDDSHGLIGLVFAGIEMDILMKSKK